MPSDLARPLFAALVAVAALGAGAPCAAGGDAAPTARLVLFGDSGTGGPEQKAVARQMRRVEDDLDHVFLLGDNVYFSGRAGRIRAAFHDVYARLLSLRRPDGTPRVRFHAALGNHDVHDCDVATHSEGALPPGRAAYAWREEGCDVEQHLEDPDFGYERGRRYYDVVVRDGSGRAVAEVYVLDSNTLPSERAPGVSDAAQIAWLRERLEASHLAGTGERPWRIVTLHNPLRTPRSKGYVFGRGGHEEDASLLAAFGNRLLGEADGGRAHPALEAEVEPLLAQGGVDAVFAGHNHFYARLEPGGDRIRHFVVGGGGIVTYEPDLATAPVVTGGGFNHFLTAVLTPQRFEYCVIDSLGRVRDHGFWQRAAEGEPDRPLDAARYDEVCGR